MDIDLTPVELDRYTRKTLQGIGEMLARERVARVEAEVDLAQAECQELDEVMVSDLPIDIEFPELPVQVAWEADRGPDDWGYGQDLGPYDWV